MTKTKPTEFWAETLEHISSTWQKKKGRKYPFTGQDLKQIKQLRGWLTAAEIMALWDCYLQASPYWGQKTGHLVSGLWAERSVLLDDPQFKKLVVKYEAALGLKSPKEVALEFGL